MSKAKNIKFSKLKLSKLLIYPDKNANKYSRGKCICLAGSDKYPGAAILCSRAAAKSGSGYTKLFTSKDIYRDLQIKSPSIPADYFSNFKLEEAEENHPLAYLIGPGFCPDDKSMQDLLIYLLSETSAPVIVDGGALSMIDKDVFASITNIRHDKGMPTILTPHMGEAKTLFEPLKQAKLKSIEKMAAALSQFYKATIVLKGPDTCICDINKINLMKDGTAALAKAGTGDVLAGIIAGFVCQNKVSVFDSCVLACNIHAKAGVLASKDLGQISVCAEDILNYIPKAIKDFA